MTETSEARFPLIPGDIVCASMEPGTIVGRWTGEVEDSGHEEEVMILDHLVYLNEYGDVSIKPGALQGARRCGVLTREAFLASYAYVDAQYREAIQLRINEKQDELERLQRELADLQHAYYSSEREWTSEQIYGPEFWG